jgi:16S rRNA pseudouridine516 synthase
MMRLDKLLASAGIGSRAEVKKLVRLGLVTVNEKVIFAPEINVNPTHDKIVVDGEVVLYQPFVYLMLNKPAGYLSARSDRTDPTIMSLIEGYDHRDLHIVGRLDKDTTGLILLTDDGAFTHHLTSPKHQIAKTYHVRVDQPIEPALVNKFSEGFSIGADERVKPAILKLTDDKHLAHLTIFEGKFHQVKRMFEKHGYKVTSLHREKIGVLTLHNLSVGQYRELTLEEITQLKSL